MIRLIDNFGSSHKDLFLIIDSTPWHLKIADSYFLYDFLEISDEALKQLKLADNEVVKYAAIELLNYWIDRIKTIEKNQRKFVPFDLSDQYVGGMMLERIKRDFKLKLVWTDKIVGHNVSKSSLDHQIADEKIIFQDSEPNEWLISEEGIYNGFTWSKKQLAI